MRKVSRKPQNRLFSRRLGIADAQLCIWCACTYVHMMLHMSNYIYIYIYIYMYNAHTRSAATNKVSRGPLLRRRPVCFHFGKCSFPIRFKGWVINQVNTVVSPKRTKPSRMPTMVTASQKSQDPKLSLTSSHAEGNFKLQSAASELFDMKRRPKPRCSFGSIDGFLKIGVHTSNEQCPSPFSYFIITTDMYLPQRTLR